MKNVIVDFRTSQKSVNSLSEMGYNVIKTPKLDCVYNEICGHADIMLHPLCENKIVVCSEAIEYLKDKLPEFELVIGTGKLSPTYPFDIAYNAARVGRHVFCNEKYTDKTILNYYYEHGFNVINVKQGYAKCSICVISDNAIISSDKGICREALKYGIDALEITNKQIKLPGFEYGFIGGATGLIPNQALIVNGDINYLKDSERIIKFCEKYNLKIISLSFDAPVDIGSIIFI